MEVVAEHEVVQRQRSPDFWEAVYRIRSGFEFLVAAAGKLSGSMQSEFFTAPIKDAVLDGDKLSFKVTIDGEARRVAHGRRGSSSRGALSPVAFGVEHDERGHQHDR